MSHTKVKNYTDKQLLDRAKSLPNFTSVPSGYWLLGIRSEADTPNVMDDKFYLFKNKTFILVTTGTTNPGKPALVNGWKKVNKNGAFVLKSDFWHYAIWQNGLHKGKMPALIQTGAEAVGYRDNNNDTKTDEVGKEYKGYFGINFHFNSYTIANGSKWSNLKGVVSWLIGGFSYGCQVANNADDYKKIIDLTKDQKNVSFCLLKEF